MSKSQRRTVSWAEHRGPVLLDHILSTEQDTLIFRLLALVIAVASLYFWQEEGTRASVAPAMALGAIYLVYTSLLGRVIVPRLLPRLASGLSSTYLVLGMCLVDTAVLTVMLYLVGGPRTMALILIPFFIIYHSIYLGYLSGLFSTTFFCMFYVGFAYLWGQAEFVIPFITFQVPSFYLLAVFSGHLTERRLKERWEKEELQRLMVLKDQGQEMPATDGTEPDLDSILREVITASSNLTKLPQCLITLLDERSGNLTGRAGNIPPEELNLSRLDKLVFDSGASPSTAVALRTGQPVVIANAIHEVHRLPIWAQWLGVGVMLVVPLVAEGRSWGIMYLFDSGAGRTISRQKVNLARGCAQLAARAIAGAQP